MKGVLLAADPGRHLRWPSVRPSVMQLAPVANRPIALHGVERICDAGATHIEVAVCDATAAALREVLGDGTGSGAEISYLEQPEATGILTTVCSLADGDDLIVHPSDVVTALDVKDMVGDFYDRSLDALMVVPAEADPERGGETFTGLALLGPRAQAAARDLVAERPDPGLGDLFDRLWADGGRVATHAAYDWTRLRADQSSLLDASRVALESMPSDAPSGCPGGPGISVEGPARIDASALVEHTTLRGPVIVGPRARISQAFIGPFTAIGADVVIDGVEIENSVVLAGVVLSHVPQRVDSSILASGARVYGDFRLPRALRLQLGERCEVGVS